MHLMVKNERKVNKDLTLRTIFLEHHPSFVYLSSHVNKNHNKSLNTCCDMHGKCALLCNVHCHHKIKAGGKCCADARMLTAICLIPSGTVSDDNVNKSANKSNHSQKTFRSRTTRNWLAGWSSTSQSKKRYTIACFVKQEKTKWGL